MRVTAWIVLGTAAVVTVLAETRTLPLADRPDWLSREGIGMAGSWKPLLYRVQRDGAIDYNPSSERQAPYASAQGCTR